VPISLKEQIDVKGVELTLGYVGWIGNVSKENSVCVQLLLDLGVRLVMASSSATAETSKAVLYVRTNIAQGLSFGESVNNVFGITSNPFNVIQRSLLESIPV
jgi:amidase